MNDKNKSDKLNARNLSPEVLGGRIPPQDLNAERAVLGALLQNRNSIITAIDLKLSEEDFYLEKNAFVFKAIENLHSNSRAVDVITVTDELKKDKKAWSFVQDEQFLWELTKEVASGAHVEFHCKIIMDKALQRKLISLSSNIIDKCMDESIESKDTLEYSEQNIFKIGEDKSAGEIRHVSQVMKDTMAMIMDYSEGGVTGVPTGFMDLDQLTTGLKPGDLIILAGRPAMGKTAFALSLLANSAITYSKSMAFFSLEMPGEQLLQRVLCSQAEVDMTALRQGRLPKGEFEKILLTGQTIQDANIFIDDNASLSLTELRSKCRSLKKKNGLDMVVIDYLQLMDGPGESRQVQIATISRGLKELAKELKIPVLALSQLSRAVEQRTGDGKPMISDLRESGAIEQDADMVWFVYRPYIYNKEMPETAAQLIVAKHRNGGLGDIDLTFIGKHAAFYNVSYRGDESSFDPHMGS